MNKSDWLERMRAETDPIDPLPQEVHDADAMLAALEEGLLTLEFLDEDLLGVAIERHGLAAVNEIIDRGALARHESSADSDAARPRPNGNILGGSAWFTRPAVQAGLAAAAVALAYFALRTPPSKPQTPSALEVAWLEFDPRPPSTAPLGIPRTVAWDRGLDWTQSLRGAAAPELAPLFQRLAVVSVDRAMGSATVIDGDGWLIAASELVAVQLQSSALGLADPIVDVQLLRASSAVAGAAEPSGEPRKATIVRHAPDLGLSLLKMADTRGLTLPPVRLRSAPPTPPAPALTVTATPSGGARIIEHTVANPSGEANQFSMRGERFSPGAQGSPSFSSAPPRDLIGIAVGPNGRGDYLFASVHSVQTLLLDRPTAAIEYPVDPLFARSESDRWITVLPWDEPAQDHVVLVRTLSKDDDETTVLFVARAAFESPESIPQSIPRSLIDPGPDSSFRFDTFLAHWPDGSVGMGRADSQGRVERIVLRRAKGTSLILWQRDGADGPWSRSTTMDKAPEELLGLDEAHINGLKEAMIRATK